MDAPEGSILWYFSELIEQWAQEEFEDPSTWTDERERLSLAVSTLVSNLVGIAAENIRLIADANGLLPAPVNLALIQAGLVPFDEDDVNRLIIEAQRQINEANQD